MQFSIIIINYNTFQLTCDCIRSVQQFSTKVNYEIILVDNASTKDDADQFKILFPEIALIKSLVNTGFAGGNNLGIAQAKGDYILLLNSDTYLTEECFAQPLSLYKNDDKLGAVSIRIKYPDGKFQHTARRFRSIGNELLDLARPVLFLLPYRRRALLMLNQYFKGDFSTECDWVSGAFMLMPKKMITELKEGKLDERFFMYGEDQLWCYQFTELGYHNYYCADVSVVHIANASTEPSKQMKLLKTMLKLESNIMEYRKGKGWYYYTFKFIFSAKDWARYYIKLAAMKLFNHKIR